MDKRCYICKSSMVRFDDQVVMFDEVPVTCSGWVCKSCGEIIFSGREVDRVLKELKEKLISDTDRVEKLYSLATKISGTDEE